MKRGISHAVEYYTDINFAVVNLNIMDEGVIVLVGEKGGDADLFGVNHIYLHS